MDLPAREWLGVTPPKPGTPDAAAGFTICTFNILAPSYARDGFDYCPREMLAWEYRFKAIAADCQRIGADVFCFQEVEFSYYDADLVPFFRELGYKGSFSRASKRDVDVGVAVFSRSGCFDYIDKHALSVRGLSSDPSFLQLFCGTPPELGPDAGGATPSADDRMADPTAATWTLDHHRNHRKYWSWYQVMHHTGLCVALRHRASGRVVLVTSFHAYWDPLWPDVKAYQLALVTFAVDRLRQQYDASEGGAPGSTQVVVAGDFNATPRIMRDRRVEDVALLNERDGLPAETPAAPASEAAESTAAAGAVCEARVPRYSTLRSGVCTSLTSGGLDPSHPHHPFTRKTSSYGVAPLAAAAVPAPAAAAAAASFAGLALGDASAAAPLQLSPSGGTPVVRVPGHSPVEIAPSPAFHVPSGAAEAGAAADSSGASTAHTAATHAAPPAAAAHTSPTAHHSAALHAESVPPVQLPLRFASAYAAVTGSEPRWSNWHFHSFKECLDYLYVGTHARSLAVLGHDGAQVGSNAPLPLSDPASEATGSRPKASPPKSPVSAPPSSGGSGAAVAAKPAASLDSLPHLVAVVAASPKSAPTGAPAPGVGAYGAADAAAAGRAPRPPITGIPRGGRVEAGPWAPLEPAAVATSGAGGSGSAKVASSASGGVGGLRAVGVLAIPSEAEVLRFEGAPGGGCPNAGCGSDHIPLVAYLRWG